ncbi:MAG: NADH-quinone oxidoreductase subunit J [Bdellovibrionales bacterium]|nr:NADH-quinone oxidoreductase subunit J [Bdellovibrionales bacterium]
MHLIDAVFYSLAILTLVSAVAVISVPNPIYSSLFLAMTMLGIAGLFFTLEAYFIAAVQLVVYAGAVVILFVMVVMLFDLRGEKRAFSKGLFSNILKLGSAGVVLAMIFSSIYLTVASKPELKEINTNAIVASKALAIDLFTKHVFAFEVIGVLLLVVLIGAMALAKGKGGTHA